MTIQITLPSLGEDVESCDVLSILVREGDVVSEGQELMEVETGKATLPVPSPEAGIIAKILVSEGDTIEIGAAIVEIDSTHPNPDSSLPASNHVDEQSNEATTTQPKPREQATSADEQPVAPLEMTSRTASGASESRRVDEFGEVHVEKMSRLRQTIARNMTLSYTTIPQLTNFDEVDVTELERVRQQSKHDYASRGIKLTVISLLVKAVALSLKQHPVINATVDMERNEVLYKDYVNIGLAVDTERGLVVPVLRGAERKNISQIAVELSQMAGAARSGEIALEQLRGGTFTISNLGSVGGTHATPIINPPEVAILLAGAVRLLPRVVDDAMRPRLVMPLSLTYDHRIVDGAAAARFLNRVKEYLVSPSHLLLSP